MVRVLASRDYAYSDVGQALNKYIEKSKGFTPGSSPRVSKTLKMIQFAIVSSLYKIKKLCRFTTLPCLPLILALFPGSPGFSMLATPVYLCVASYGTEKLGGSGDKAKVIHHNALYCYTVY